MYQAKVLLFIKNIILSDPYLFTLSTTYLLVLFVVSLLLLVVLMLAFQLRQKQEELTQANINLINTLQEMKQLSSAHSYFIRIIAHDMRRPLISFRGLADILNNLLKAGDFLKIKAISQDIDSTSLALETMLDNLILWAISQHEPIPYQPENLEVADIMHKVVNIFELLTKYDKITITLQCPSDLTLFADPNALKLILRNLIDNAIKNCSEQGDILIACEEKIDSNMVQIMVTDNGVGIKKSQLEIIQDVLAGRRITYPEQVGMGMGLMLVRDFTIRNQGSVFIESKLEQGTQVFLLLPRANF
ncbi:MULTISPECIES: HAMP domain-containing sensor histidine kinase [unclassified Spirosoma]|uniref:sensor histidine kinase n=1 Tax=unclassified Spirosoma TaxID=2621999 RepID=UPI00095C37F9|nr:MULTISPECIES: HAMP domain-containing sensor histidine kinase [unclassified Spirosoma]MBN8820641.1 HAMP domain-containing histidine kinase [Spirosoma sp.]OJW70518.1 MAG: hypothetical protein BGO59_25095 [Spirosoma sp. 48-14]